MKKMMLSLLVLMGLSFSNSVFAQEGGVTQDLKKTSDTTLEGRNTVEAEAKVLNVNKKTREITFQAEDGEKITVKATDDVRNFDQIKKGDILKIRYAETLILELKKKGKEPNGAVRSTDIVRSAPGEKPGGSIVSRISAIGTITALDKKGQNVTVRGPERTVTLHIKDKSILNDLKKGDQIEAQYTEALAVSVETVKR